MKTEYLSKNKNYSKKLGKVLLNQKKLFDIININNKILLDGYAIRQHRPSTKEQINLLKYNKDNKEKISLFKKNYPFLSTLSKRTCINNSKTLLPNILNYSKNKMIIKDDFSKSFYQPFKYKCKSFSKSRKTNYSVEINNNEYLKTHNTNFYNQTQINKRYLDNYEKNPYKVKKFHLNEDFMSKIRHDVIKLKFNNLLKLDL